MRMRMVDLVPSSLPLLGEDVVSSKWADAKVTVCGLFASETNTRRRPSSNSTYCNYTN